MLILVIFINDRSLPTPPAHYRSDERIPTAWWPQKGGGLYMLGVAIPVAVVPGAIPASKDDGSCHVSWHPIINYLLLLICYLILLVAICTNFKTKPIIVRYVSYRPISSILFQWPKRDFPIFSTIAYLRNGQVLNQNFITVWLTSHSIQLHYRGKSCNLNMNISCSSNLQNWNLNWNHCTGIWFQTWLVYINYINNLKCFALKFRVGLGLCEVFWYDFSETLTR